MPSFTALHTTSHSNTHCDHRPPSWHRHPNLPPSPPAPFHILSPLLPPLLLCFATLSSTDDGAREGSEPTGSSARDSDGRFRKHPLNRRNPIVPLLARTLHLTESEDVLGHAMDVHRTVVRWTEVGKRVVAVAWYENPERTLKLL
ncbi:hypothetical protein M427DRAFT_38266 [Gonapodya prolifera JEL478]|uniref:Uncharacterized protein n=1 Tax=Gonapodya prolifera (strain JEL478) TaxID=1344416 RepID=A0A138ZZC0_GONPJ|nr:hypothetical protein M427DRAFT_38266 [Gonapodya prolifera JEL478]|eukprot:KXS09840.1 hypothetical protein M427DRAFT_38266 [Gonapodya prolifera JEL478]